MALFAKDYHPLDSRHPRNRAGARAGDYGVTLAPKAANPQMADRKPAEPAASSRLSRSAQLAALAAQTQAKARAKAASAPVSGAQTDANLGAPADAQAPLLDPKDSARPAAASPFEGKPTKPAAAHIKKPFTGIWRTAQVVTQLQLYMRLGMLIALAVYLMLNPYLVAEFLGFDSSRPPYVMQSAPNF